MIDLDELLAQIWPLAAKQLPSSEHLDLKHALGRVLAQDVYSQIDVPQHDNSAMDGYAVRCADLLNQQPLLVSQRIPAGTSPLPLEPGTVARIFTGAPIPQGADAIVMQEDVQLADDGRVLFNTLPKPGQWIRHAGEDISTGQIVLLKGTLLTGIHLGLLASIGVATLPVFKRLKVGVMVTGSELQNPGELLQPGQIYNSNEFVWTALLQSMNIEVESVGIVPDSLSATCEALKALSECDVVIGSGGVSVGEEDHVRFAIEEVGELRSWRVGMKPGKPVAFGHIRRAGGGQSWFFGLPGNPVSSTLTFQLLAMPFLGLLQGRLLNDVDWRLCMRPVKARFEWLKPDSRREEFLRVGEMEAGCVTLFPNQSSGVLTSLAQSTGLVRLPKGQLIHPGDVLNYLSFQDLMK